MTKLSVNINKIAVVRNSRGGNRPDVVRAALDIERFGADGITVHPRPDARHIRYDDVRALTRVLATEFNIEGNPIDSRCRGCRHVECRLEYGRAPRVPANGLRTVQASRNPRFDLRRPRGRDGAGRRRVRRRPRGALHRSLCARIRRRSRAGDRALRRRRRGGAPLRVGAQCRP